MADVERDTRIVWQKPEALPPAARFFERLEEDSLKQEIVKTLTYRIPRLWQLEFTDSDGTDLPLCLFQLMDELENWCDVTFDDDSDEEEALQD